MISVLHRYTKDSLSTAETIREALAVRPIDLRSCDLSGQELDGINLSGIYLSGADLRGASLRKAVLNNCDFWGADLTGANLTGAQLRGCNFSWADLRKATLTNADTNEAKFTRANLVGCIVGIKIPVVHAYDREMDEATSKSGAFDVSNWHTTKSHCRSGWAVKLAGDAGWTLEKKVGPWLAGALIHAASTGDIVPDYFASSQHQLADIAWRRKQYSKAIRIRERLDAKFTTLPALHDPKWYYSSPVTYTVD